MSHITNDKINNGVDEDLDFVSSCKKGNVDAFEVLVERYQKQMLNIAYRMIDNYDDACEVVQEAFLSAFKSINKFRGEAKFSTWLISITINHAKNRLKQVQRQYHHESVSIDNIIKTDDNVITYEPQSNGIPIIEQLEQKEVQLHVQNCISSLDEEYREIVVLRDMQGFSYEEICLILKIPEGTVKSRLFRARDFLRDCLKKVIGDI